MKKIIIVAVLVLMSFTVVMAQSSPDDPAVIKAKEETQVVFDLGRLFGYLNTMVKDEKSLALTKDQIEDIYRIMVRIKQTDRMEVEMADEMLTNLEDSILTPDQLMYTDQLAIAKMEERTVKTGQGGGGGQITNYIAGGAFNPMVDPSKPMGKDFAEFFEYVEKKAGK